MNNYYTSDYATLAQLGYCGLLKIKSIGQGLLKSIFKNVFVKQSKLRFAELFFLIFKLIKNILLNQENILY